ncbi:MAG: lamin tail domain-containing protein, partial [Bacteroidota bacterium]
DENNFFTIPAGTVVPANGYLVLVQNVTAFQSIYPAVSNVVGPWSFGLGGGGEYVALLTDERCLVDILRYNDAPPWDPNAEGNGLTLSLMSPDRDNELAGSWIANGPTPGAPNNIPDPCVGINADILISEIYYNSPPNIDAGNWLELYNNSAVSQDISSWEIHADDTSFVLPSINIAANSYLVLVEDSNAFSSFYPSVNNYIGNMGFGLENGRDQLLLYSQSRCLIDSVEYAGKAPWDPEADGFGPSLSLKDPATDNAQPESWQASWGSGTPGQAHGASVCNSLEQVIINEIHYHSPDDANAGDWVELYNPTANPIDISNWTLRGDKDRFYLPNTTTLSAHSFLVLVEDSAKFEAIHGGVSNYIGETGFGLDNGGESLALFDNRYCFVDSLTFADEIPWPLAADGQGASMALLDPALDNALGENWYAETGGTPGRNNEYDCGPGGENVNRRVWLYADEYGGPLTDNSSLSNWTDLSGFGNDASQSDPADQPHYFGDEINGHGVVRFDGSQDWLKINGAVSTLTDSFSLFVVFRPQADTDDGYYLSTHNGGANRIKFGHRIAGQLIYDDDDPSMSNDVYFDQSTIVSMNLVPNSSINSYINGQPALGLNSFGSTGADRASIGQEYDGQGNDNQTSNHWKGDLAEMILFRSNLASEERHQIESYLAIKYGLTIPVSSHQYYTQHGHPHALVSLGMDVFQCLDQRESKSEVDGSVLTLSEMNDLDHLEFLTLGHDGGSVAEGDAMNDGPEGILQRMNRSWRVSKIGQPGTLTLDVDLAGQGWDLSDEKEWVLLIDDDGNWQDASVLATAQQISDEIVRFTEVALNDGDWVSIGRRRYLQLNASVMLQGPFDVGSGLMKDDLRQQNLIPLLNPYQGTDSMDKDVLAFSGSGAVVDWILVELRSAMDSSQVLTSYPLLLRRDGQIIGRDGMSSPILFPVPEGNTFFVSLKHRNHLGIMTESAVEVHNHQIDLDFANGNQATWGTHSMANLSGSQWGLWAGDANGDGQITFQSSDPSEVFLRVLLAPGNLSFARNFVWTAYDAADVNMDGKVIFQGQGADVSSVFLSILLYPQNSGFQRNYIISSQLPD